MKRDGDRLTLPATAANEIGSASASFWDSVAFVTAIMHCSGTEASGTGIELDFRLTVGLRKIDDQWIVVHEHHSIPATWRLHAH